MRVSFEKVKCEVKEEARRATTSRNFLTTGTRSFLTSSTARASFRVARFSVSSTVSSTWSSSVRCSQFGLPRFCSSWINKNVFTRISVLKFFRILYIKKFLLFSEWCGKKLAFGLLFSQLNLNSL